jgi:hypothetical protein
MPLPRSIEEARAHLAEHPEQKRKLQKLKDDYPTFAEKFLSIRTKEGEIKPLALNTAQRYIHEQAQDQKRRTGRVRKLVVKGRQQGCSTYIEGRAYHYTSTRRGRRAYILAHEQDATNNIFEMAQRFYDNCPPIIRPHASNANAKELLFDVLDSGIKVGTAGTRGGGRSQTNQFFHGSEVAYWPFAETHAGGIMQTIPDIPDTEAWLESTAAGRGNYFHTQAEKARNGDSEFELIFIPWFWQTEYRKAPPADFKMTEDEQKLAAQFGLDAAQLCWRRMKVAELEMDSEFGVTALTGEDRFRGEYPNTFDESFDAAIPGAYYGKLMADASNESRVGREPHITEKSVSTAWDLGYNDTTAIWFYQQNGPEVRLIDYYEMSGQGLDHYAKYLRDKPYRYQEHNWPHDGGNGDFSTGKTRVQLFAEMGFNARVLERDANIMDGINAVRQLLPRCYFDASKCSQGIQAMRQYRCEYDANAKVFKLRPLHNWASNGADAFRTLARAVSPVIEERKPERYKRHPSSGGSVWARL